MKRGWCLGLVLCLISVSSHGHTLVFLSLLRFYSNLSPCSTDDSGFAYFPFYSGVADFTSSFVSVYFISFYLLVVSGLPLFVPIYFYYTVLSEDGSDESSELVSHQMAHPSPIRDSLSKLSSHQIPHCLLLEGSTTAKGLYEKSYYVFQPLRLRGRLCYNFGFGAELACSAAARVTSSLPISGFPFVFA